MKPQNIYIANNLVRRLHYGSVGAEFWSSTFLAVFALLLLIRQEAVTYVGSLLLRVTPVAPLLLLAIGIAHFILLCLPNHPVTIVLRKFYSAMELSLWVALSVEGLQRGSIGVLLFLWVHIVLLIFSLLRRQY